MLTPFYTWDLSVTCFTLGEGIEDLENIFKNY